MNPTLLGAIAGVLLVSALAYSFFIRWRDRKRRIARLAVPEFVGRQEQPRAITRLHKDQLTWEI